MNARTIIKLVFLSLLVGLAMSFFGYGPADIWTRVIGFGKSGFDAAVGFFDWALLYIMIGAAVVVPVFILSRLFKKWPKSRRD